MEQVTMNDPMPPRSIHHRLEPGERLLWWGQPKRGLVLRWDDLTLIPVSVLVLGIALLWEVMALKEGRWGFEVWWGIPFIFIGFDLVIGRFFRDDRRRAKTFYGLTDRRILFVAKSECHSLSLENVPEINLKEWRNGTASLVLGREPSAVTDNGVTINWTGEPSVPTLERIKDAPRVYRAIREAQAPRKLRSTPQWRYRGSVPDFVP